MQEDKMLIEIKDKRNLGVFMVENSAIDDETLSMKEKMVYIVLLRYASGRGECWPSISTIRKKAGCSASTVRRALEGLEKRNIIKIETRKKENSVEYTSNMYHIIGVEYDNECIKPRKKESKKTKKENKPNKNKFRNFNETFDQYTAYEMDELIKAKQNEMDKEREVKNGKI